MKTAYSLVRECPICNAKQAQLLCTIDLCPIDGECLPPTFNVVACTNCGFCFDDINATQNDFDKYYAHTVKYSNPQTRGSGGLSAFDRERYDEILKRIHSYIHRESVICDYGAGNGGFLSYMKEKGYVHLYAVEPSLLQKHENYFSSLQEMQESIGTVDMLVCSHVFEHIFDLQQATLSLMSALNPVSGLAYVEVPNAANYAHALKAPFYYFDREHINHFTENSLQNLFAINGLKCVGKGTVARSEKCVYGLFSRGSDKNAIIYDGKVSEVKLYVDNSSSTKIEIPDCSGDVFVWGLGAYLRMIINKPFFPKKLTAIIDRDKGGAGVTLQGIPVLSSDAVFASENATVIISSVLYAEEIERYLKSKNFCGRIHRAF